MRTLPSHDEAERYSAAGEKAMSEMLSSGGLLMGTSFERSPVVGVLELEDPNRPAMSAFVKKMQICDARRKIKGCGALLVEK